MHARNGEEAVEICTSEGKIDLVLMDMNMPVLNGFSATRKIKKIFPEMPVLAQTAYAVAGDREKIIESGCYDYISKPVKADDLLSKIRYLIEKG